MKITVCVSHVPDTASKILVAEDGKSINNNGVTYIINPYDEFAVEEALKTKESVGDAEVTVISIGNDSSKDTIRKALAMGADKGILLKTEEIFDSLTVSKLLADEIKAQESNLVFMGKQSVDFDNSIVGQMTAELLGYNCVSVVVGFEMDSENIKAKREIEGGHEVVSTSLPAIITTQKGLNTPRYASLKGIMAAKRKTIEEKDVSIEQLSSEIVEMKNPSTKSAGKILGSDASAVPELVNLLKNEAKLI